MYLQEASRQEKAGNLTVAIANLDSAEKHTSDYDELAHLGMWRKRLKDKVLDTAVASVIGWASGVAEWTFDMPKPKYRVIGTLRTQDAPRSRSKEKYLIYEGSSQSLAESKAHQAVLKEKAWDATIEVTTTVKYLEIPRKGRTPKKSLK